MAERSGMALRALCYVLLTMGALSFLYPFIWMLSATVKPVNEIFSFNPVPSHVTFQWYHLMLKKIPAFRGLFNSLIVSSAIAASQVLLGSLVGFGLARYRFAGRDFIFGIVIFTMVIPAQLTLIPLYLLVTKLGWLDSYFALIIPGMVGGFSIFLFRQFFLTIPQDLIEAARLDGLSDLGILFRIFYPLSRPAIITVGMLSFMGSWNDVLWPIVVIRKWEMMTLPQLITLFQIGGLAGGQVAVQLASTTVMVVPVLLAYLFFQRYFIEGIATSGLK
ncbi:MAG: carbohydrate ABC transporter permease [Candidatus Eremiobacteraeota bacterium]|nr:carbohydrate ABC transporter permease [Candidatus Eremiobacteraeota bacterium]